jgi:DNA-binding transcriptional MerR regulator
MDHPGYTIREIARELNLPESTIRYYRDAFALYLPTWGMGRRRRYPPEALELLRLIADGYAQSQTREQIEARVQEVAAPVAAARPAPRPTPPPRSAVPEQMTAMMLDDERERRDVMWQMAKEIVRIGERIERQHMLLGEIARRLELTSHRTLGSGFDDPIAAIPPAGGTSHGSANDVEQKLEGELRQMREELERERELVERLRRAKLDIERRATVAETQLQERGRGA